MHTSTAVARKPLLKCTLHAAHQYLHYSRPAEFYLQISQYGSVSRNQYVSKTAD